MKFAMMSFMIFLNTFQYGAFAYTTDEWNSCIYRILDIHKETLSVYNSTEKAIEKFKAKNDVQGLCVHIRKKVLPALRKDIHQLESMGTAICFSHQEIRAIKKSKDIYSQYINWQKANCS